MTESKENLYDLRVVHIYIKRGKVSPEEYQKYLDTLEDSAANSTETDTRFVATFANRHG
jgi:hypothetical protein